ncbi:unnamed protein product [Cuscuta campestris]|uniref:Uncharacterized protein n=1 Tax=Cuscuta campestris TaxID=132261 RepID=A0A484L2P7_9ASTE|nr:unnamed protein product [Cuscuta campestris]
MHSGHHWGGPLEICANNAPAESSTTTTEEWDRASGTQRSSTNHRHADLDETQQSWLLGASPDDSKRRKKYVDLGCVVCSRKALAYSFWAFLLAFLVFAVPTVIVRVLPRHRPRPPPPDNYSAALHPALLFFNAQKCK